MRLYCLTKINKVTVKCHCSNIVILVKLLAVAPGRSGAGPVRVRNVSLSKRLTPRGNKEKAIMDTEPKKQEPEIVPPAPVVEPARNVPEIPPDKDTPEKRSPVQAKAGLIAS
jgi:hypothetical protein